MRFVDVMVLNGLGNSDKDGVYIMKRQSLLSMKSEKSKFRQMVDTSLRYLSDWCQVGSHLYLSTYTAVVVSFRPTTLCCMLFRLFRYRAAGGWPKRHNHGEDGGYQPRWK